MQQDYLGEFEQEIQFFKKEENELKTIIFCSLLTGFIATVVSCLHFFIDYTHAPEIKMIIRYIPIYIPVIWWAVPYFYIKKNKSSYE